MAGGKEYHGVCIYRKDKHIYIATDTAFIWIDHLTCRWTHVAVRVTATESKLGLKQS